MPEKIKAVVNGLKEGTIEAVKLIPGVSILIEGVRKYQESIEEQQREQFLKVLGERLSNLEGRFNPDWYTTTEGEEISRKIIASALNAEFSDKTEYFTNALINAHGAFLQQERLKFIEILRIISKPALEILAAEHRLHIKRGKQFSPQVLKDVLIRETRARGFSPHLVESCLYELLSLGVFSNTTGFGDNGKPNTCFPEGTAAYTDFTERFISFIQDPRS